MPSTALIRVDLPDAVGAEDGHELPAWTSKVARDHTVRPPSRTSRPADGGLASWCGRGRLRSCRARRRTHGARPRVPLSHGPASVGADGPPRFAQPAPAVVLAGGGSR